MVSYTVADDDVVISGISASFPGVANISEVFENLSRGVQPRATSTEKIPIGYIGEFPPSLPLTNSHLFDNLFYGISKQASKSANAHIRILLGRVFEALLDAGLQSDDVKDIICDVYENVVRHCGELSDMSVQDNNYTVMGRARSMTPNRISVACNVKGTSVSQDSGDNGGFNAVKMAWLNIRSGRADMAIICSSNFNISNKITQQCNDLGWISKKGITRPFDNEADGFVRGEGAVAFIMQRGKNAKRIYAKIKHIESGVLQRDLTLTKQSSRNWEFLLNKFYKDSQIPMEKIAYLEAYAPGLKEWEAEELNAVTNVMCKNRETPLLIGSIKSAIGYQEAVADYASIIQALICFQTGVIPKTFNYETPNRAVNGLLNNKIQVVDEVTPFPSDGLIAINSWSYGGHYGHLVLEGYPKPKKEFTPAIPRLIPLSARTDDFINNQVKYLSKIPYHEEFFGMVTELFSKKMEKFLGRGYIFLPGQEEVISHQEVLDESVRPLWFVCSGMGSQWIGMGTALMKLPIINESIQRSHQIMEKFGVDLIDIITTSDATIFDNILNSFVGIAAIQIALIDVLNALGIVADGFIGHSVGELACAYADGCLSAEEMLLAAYYRGKASLDADLVKGMMAAVGLGYEQIKDRLPEGVEVACHNSSTSCTLTGLAENVENFVEKLTEEGVFARTVNVAGIAYHSSYIQPAAPFLLNNLKKVLVNPKPRSKKWLSTSVPESEWESELAMMCSAEYQTNNLLSPVLFEETSRHIPENAILVEIAPHALLQAILKRSMDKKTIHIPLCSRSAQDPLIYFLQAIGKLHCAGLQCNINALYPPFDYPLPCGSPSMQPLIHWVNTGNTWDCDEEQNLKINIRSELAECDSSMSGYKIGGKDIFPLSTYIHGVEKLNSQYENTVGKKNHLIFIDLRFHAIDALSVSDDSVVEGSIHRGTKHFEVVAKNETNLCSGKVNTLKEPLPLPEVELDDEILLEITKCEIYDWFTRMGYIIPETLQLLESIEVTNKGLRAKIGQCSSYGRLEAALQLFLYDTAVNETDLIFPSSILELWTYPLENIDSDVLIFNRALCAISGPGLYIYGVKVAKLSCVHNPLTFHAIRQTPYVNPTANTKEFVQLCCEIIEHSGSSLTKVLDIECSEIVEEIQKNLPGLKIYQEAVSGENYDVVVCSSKILNAVANISTEFIFVQGKVLSIPADFSLVTVAKTDLSTLSLIKKKIILESNFVLIKNETPSAVVELLKLRRPKFPVLIVNHSKPAEGIYQFCSDVQSNVDLHIKWMFILDENAPNFSLTESLYFEQYAKGLAFNIYENGEWSFVVKTSLNESVVENHNGVIMNDIAKTATGKNSMKIGIRNGTNFDDILQWIAPPTMAQPDAPLHYALAYYCLQILANTQPYQRVLVTDGLSEGGQAAISVALTLVKKVFASVATEEERIKLNQLFPEMKINDIILHSDRNFGIHFRLQCGSEAPEIIYNFLEGHHFKTILENIPHFAKIFHFGKDDIAKNTIIGMSPFINSASLYGITPSVVLNRSNDEKKILWELVNDGINTGVVRPLVTAAQKPVTKEFKIDPTATYVVFGDTSEVDLGIAEWLARRGSKKLIIFPSQTPSTPYRQRINALKVRFGTSVRCLDVKEVKKTLLQEAPELVFTVNAFGVKLTEDFKFKRVVSVVRKGEPLLSETFADKTTNVIWNIDANQMDRTLNEIAPRLSHSLIAVEDETPRKTKELVERLIQLTIPNSVDAFIRLGNSISSASFTQLPTAGRQDVLEVPPLFIFPGIRDDPLNIVKDLVREYGYTAYMAHIPKGNLISADIFIPMMQKLLTSSTFNLVGISTGCSVVLELAKILESQGCAVAVLLVDDPINRLHEGFASIEELRFSLLKNVISLFTDTITVKSDSAWTVQLNHIRSFLDPSKEPESFLRAVEYCAEALISCFEYRMEAIRGPLTVVQLKEKNFNYNHVCLNNTKVSIEEENLHESSILKRLLWKIPITPDFALNRLHLSDWMAMEDIYERHDKQIKEERTMKVIVKSLK